MGSDNKKQDNLNLDFVVERHLPIYRYLSFIQLVHILETKKLFLKKVCYWDDPSEGNRYVSVIQNDALTAVGRNITDVEIIEGIKRRDFPFGTSWSLLEESDAMWRIYSQNKMGVQIRTTVAKLEEALYNIELRGKYRDLEEYCSIRYAVGKVAYRPVEMFNFQQELAEKEDEKDISLRFERYRHTHEQLEHFLLKKEAFKHEEEIRGLLKVSYASALDVYIPPLAVDRLRKFLIETEELFVAIGDDFVEQVRVDPRADDWTFETIKQYCKARSVSNVERSSLYGR